MAVFVQCTCVQDHVLLTALLTMSVGLAHNSVPAELLVPTTCTPEAGTEFVGGNLFNKFTPNHTSAGAPGCCTLCQAQHGCELWTFNRHA